MSIGVFTKRLEKIMRNDSGVDGTAQRLSQIVWILCLKVFDYKESEWELEENYKSVIPFPFRFRDWADPRNEDGIRNIKDRMTGDTLVDFVNNKLFPFLKGLEVEVGEKRISFDLSNPKAVIIRDFIIDSNNYMKNGVYLRQVIDEIAAIDFDNSEEKHEFNEIYEELLKELQSAGTAGEFYTPRALTRFITDHVNPQIGDDIADFACGTGGFLVEAITHLRRQISSVDDIGKIQEAIYGVEWKPLPYMLCITNLFLHDIDIPHVLHGDGLSNNILDITEKDRYKVVLMNPPFGGNVDRANYANYPNDLVSPESADLFVARIIYCLKKNGRCGLILPDGLLFSKDTAKVAIKKKLLSECNLHTVIRLPQTVFSPYTDVNTNLLFFDKTGKTEAIWFYRFDMPEGRKHFNMSNPIRRRDLDIIDQWWDNRVEIKDERENDSQTETWKAKRYSMEEIEESGYVLDLCGYPKKKDVVLPPDQVMFNYVSKKTELEKSLSLATDSFNKFLNGRTETQVLSIKDISRELVRLNTSFPINMYNSLLKYAMMGTLTEMENGDTDVGDIVERYGLVLVPDQEQTLDIPEYWRWVRLQGLCQYVQRGKSPKYSKIEKIPVIAQKCNQWAGFQLEKAQFIVPETLSSYTEERKLQDEDILINSTGLGTVGRCAIYPAASNPYGIAVADSHVTVVRLKKEIILPQFFYYYWCNPSVQDIIESQTTGSTKQKELGITIVRNYVVPLPPIEEQMRIIEKLDRMIPMVN